MTIADGAGTEIQLRTGIAVRREDGVLLREIPIFKRNRPREIRAYDIDGDDTIRLVEFILGLNGVWGFYGFPPCSKRLTRAELAALAAAFPVTKP